MQRVNEDGKGGVHLFASIRLFEPKPSLYQFSPFAQSEALGKFRQSLGEIRLNTLPLASTVLPEGKKAHQPRLRAAYNALIFLGKFGSNGGICKNRL